MMSGRLSLGIVVSLLGMGCGGGLPNPATPPKPVLTGEAFDSTSCSAVRPKTEPDLMGWDSTSRASLNSLKDQGVVVVHYEAVGCNVQLEVLSNCIATGE